jgi:hypothetical protein
VFRSAGLKGLKVRSCACQTYLENAGLRPSFQHHIDVPLPLQAPKKGNVKTPAPAPGGKEKKVGSLCFDCDLCQLPGKWIYTLVVLVCDGEGGF